MTQCAVEPLVVDPGLDGCDAHWNAVSQVIDGDLDGVV